MDSFVSNESSYMLFDLGLYFSCQSMNGRWFDCSSSRLIETAVLAWVLPCFFASIYLYSSFKCFAILSGRPNAAIVSVKISILKSLIGHCFKLLVENEISREFWEAYIASTSVRPTSYQKESP